MPHSRTTLILPVESQSRELDAKLLLACVAAERGFRVVLGSRSLVHHQIPRLERGVYLAKSMRSLSEPMFRILSRLGHDIVAWDEEALVRFPQEDYYRRRLSAKALSRVSHLFAWGEDDARIFREFPAYPGTPIHITGNPRIDLLRPELRAYFDREVEEIREEFGDLILVNTNFGFVNSFANRLNLTQQQSGTGDGPVLGDNARGMRNEFASGLAAHKRALFDQFRAVLPRLAEAFPKRQIVIRPHPAESHDPWAQAAAGHSNLHVRAERGVAPWLIAAGVLVHNGCTTAIEAAVLGTPSIAFTPVRASSYDFDLPNGLSSGGDRGGAANPEALIEALGTVASAKSAQENAIPRTNTQALANSKPGELQKHIAALDGPLAVDRMVDALCQAGYHERVFSAPAPVLGAFSRLAVRVRKLTKAWRGRRPGHRNSAAFHDHRFPGTSVAELHERIGRFSRQLARFDGVVASELSQQIYLIEGSGAGDTGRA